MVDTYFRVLTVLQARKRGVGGVDDTRRVTPRGK